LGNTLLLSSLAALAAAVLGVPIGYAVTRLRSPLTSLLEAVATLPFAVAGTVTGIALIISFNSGWLVLTGGWLIMVVAYVVRKLPSACARPAASCTRSIRASRRPPSISASRRP